MIRTLIAHSFPALLLAAPEAAKGGPAPANVPPTPAKKKNRFLDHLIDLGTVTFTAAMGEPRTFESGKQKGTKRTKLADVSIMLRNLGVPMAGCTIVMDETPNGATGFLFKFPSSGTGFYSKQVIAVPKADENANTEIKAAGDAIVERFKVWAADEKKKNGGKSIFKQGSAVKLANNIVPVAPTELADIMGDDTTTTHTDQPGDRPPRL